MRIKTLRFASFRNLKDASVELSGQDVFLVGENGQGKTNFLEAVYFCAYASSFRGVPDDEIACKGSKSFSAGMTFEDSLCQEILVKVEGSAKSDKKKTILIDGKKASDRGQLLRLAPVIAFSPTDMNFVSGTPERRRWFFDQNLSLYDNSYLEDFRNYKHIVKTRNTILRTIREKRAGFSPDREALSLLDALDPQLAEYGLRVQRRRKIETEAFCWMFERLYAEVSGIEGVRVEYRPSWKEESPSSVLERLASRREADISFGSTSSGPLHDRYIFTRDLSDFTQTASTGQRRLLALLLRVGQALRFCSETSKAPILLLDDVLLELDGPKKRRFLSSLPPYGQALYTFLPEEPFQSYLKSDTQVFRVSGGEVK